METHEALRALGALAHPSRLAVFRILARVAPDGMPAGDLSVRVGVPGPTMSFHLGHLARAGLIRSERMGRTLLYALRPEALRELFWFLGEDCCQGRTELCCDVAERIDGRAAEAAAGSAAGAGAEDHRPHVLFVCTRNAARSQMAEAILRAEAGDRFAVSSAGLQPGDVHPLTRRMLEEIGVDAAGLVAKDLGSLLGKQAFSTAIVLCEAAHEACARIRTFAPETLYWPFLDPLAEHIREPDRPGAFRATSMFIRGRIRTWLRAQPV
jgi:arsenate reductase